MNIVNKNQRLIKDYNVDLACSEIIKKSEQAPLPVLPELPAPHDEVEIIPDWINHLRHSKYAKATYEQMRNEDA